MLFFSKVLGLGMIRLNSQNVGTKRKGDKCQAQDFGENQREKNNLRLS